MKSAKAEIERVSARFTSRTLNDRLKRVAKDAKDLSTLEKDYAAEMATIDIPAIFNDFKSNLEQTIWGMTWRAFFVV